MNVVVTGGGTNAPIDDVRLITNVSSGRFSAMITEACLQRGATVWHVHARSAMLPYTRLARFDLDAADLEQETARVRKLADDYRAVRDRLHLVPLRDGTVAEYAATLERIVHERPVDVVFLAMAVSDFEPIAVRGKIDSAEGDLVIRGRPTPKVIRAVRDWAPESYLVGFKLLSGVPADDLIRTAEAANRTNRADLTIANDLQLLREGRHTVHLVRPGQPTETLGPSDTLAEQMVDKVFTWLQAERTRGA
jgi:phosphopantothenate-cysteine ligase